MNEQIMTVVEAPEIIMTKCEKAGDILLKFYRNLGWNGVDNLDPCKIRTTKDVFANLFDVMFKCLPDSLSVGMTMVNIGPGTDDFIPPGKVFLLDGWVTPAGSNEAEK